jgi:hypothetical protein
MNSLDLEEEYRIYDVIIESSYADKPALIILNQTSSSYMLDTHTLEYLKENYPSFDELLGGYIKRSNQQYQLEGHFTPVSTEVRLVDSEYVDWIFEATDFDLAWQAFNEMHPESYGFLGLSQISANRQQDKALVFVHRNCGPTCGSGNLFLVAKVGNEWQVVEIMTLFLA